MTSCAKEELYPLTLQHSYITIMTSCVWEKVYRYTFLKKNFDKLNYCNKKGERGSKKQTTSPWKNVYTMGTFLFLQKK